MVSATSNLSLSCSAFKASKGFSSLFAVNQELVVVVCGNPYIVLCIGIIMFSDCVVVFIIIVF